MFGLVRGPLFQKHDPGEWHCEIPQRLQAIDEALEKWPGMQDAFQVPLRAARESELTRVHQHSHFARIASTDGRSVSLDPDTATSPQSFRAAINAVGTLIDLCDLTMKGEVENGMALVRPPGHHATPNRAMGFCLFNNVALAAAHLLMVHGLERVLIVDWDVHHGNGTEDCFYQDDRVLYFSCHQAPFYPGTGPVQAMGAGRGEGYNINVPMPGGMGDGEFIRIFEDLLVPVAKGFSPQFILISAGYDGHQEDPLGGMQITDQGFAALTEIMLEVSEDCCPGKMVLTLEGGYNPAALSRSVVACLNAMLGKNNGSKARSEAVYDGRPAGLVKAIDLARQYWEV